MVVAVGYGLNGIFARERAEVVEFVEHQMRALKHRLCEFAPQLRGIEQYARIFGLTGNGGEVEGVHLQSVAL